MTDSFSSIKPKQVPLSHVEPVEAAVRAGGGRWLTIGLGALLAFGLLGIVFFVLPNWLEGRPATPSQTLSAPGAGATTDAGSTPSASASEDPQLPPFQQLQREQARERAKEELSRFVELQISLEDSMQVGAWGKAAYDQAKSLAAEGDEQFLREQFQQSVESYQSATRALEALMAEGQELLESSLVSAGEALIRLDADAAAAALNVAATIAPEDPRVIDGRARLDRVPEIQDIMREARNDELAGDWTSAEAAYDRIHDLDPAVAGLEDARARVAAGRREARVQALLSEAFARLDAGQFDGARQSFREVLAIAPGNPVATGGLEQVAKQADVTRINGLRERADTAMANENWDEAIDYYDQVLSLDSNIRFAQAGRSQAEAQRRTQTTLGRILQNPDRLSSEKLYREAQAILEQARTLEPRGSGLTRQIEDVGAILDAYANPVAVVLRSDNRTEVTLSTVGRLGSFEEKTLELRPGAYTVIGSRDGCRDIREQIVVRPNMNPVDIRCTETL